MQYNKDNPLKVCELFAGYGSQRLALNRLKQDFADFNFEVVAISEIDKTALKAYELLHGDCPNLGDVSTINWSLAPDFDLVTWSFPCTDLSVAGKQMGMSEDSNTRSSLCWEALRCIKEKKPKYALMENVSAIHQQKFIPEFKKLQLELESYGYVNFWQDLNAKDFGVPQSRNRTFMVSVLQDCDENPRYEFPEPFKLEKRLRDVLEPNVDDSYYLRKEQVERVIIQNSIAVEPTIQSVGNIYPSGGQGGKVVAPTGIAPTVCECHGEVTRIVEPQISAHPLSHTRENPTPRANVAPTLRATDYKAPQCVYEHQPQRLTDKPMLRIRKLTPRECYRLMNVDDCDIDKLLNPTNAKGKPLIAKSQHYKLAGNSICVCCLYYIFYKLLIDTKPNSPIQLSLF